MKAQTKSAPVTQSQMPDILTFRQMMQSFKVKSKDSAVLARHYAQDVEAWAKKLKETADEVLYSQKDNARIEATDEAGNTWAVTYVPQNQKEYELTKEYYAALTALEAAQEAFEAVKENTPFKMVRKGEKGYSYKVTNPTPTK